MGFNSVFKGLKTFSGFYATRILLPCSKESHREHNLVLDESNENTHRIKDLFENPYYMAGCSNSICVLRSSKYMILIQAMRVT